jgi:hypothetical protein
MRSLGDEPHRLHVGLYHRHLSSRPRPAGRAPVRMGAGFGPFSCRRGGRAALAGAKFSQDLETILFCSIFLGYLFVPANRRTSVRCQELT